jgi:surface protein
MKKLLLLIISLFLTAQTIKAQTVVLDTNGVTIKYTGTTRPTPYFIQASPRGTLEWFAIVDNSTKNNITNYANNNQSGITYFTPPGSSTRVPYNNIVTTLVTNMADLFNNSATFNQPIGSWDVSNVTTMANMFNYAYAFNQPIGSWDVSNVTNMSEMFLYAKNFNQPIGSWNVSNVTTMASMFFLADVFNQPIGSWDVSNVTIMDSMFELAIAFNQPIGSWNVSNVTNMAYMLDSAKVFNQPIGSWNVSNVTNMQGMFYGAIAFNQNIGSWNVSNVTNMRYMFRNTDTFNQNISSWNVINVTDIYGMNGMFSNAKSFNQNIGSWNVSNVTNMQSMFLGAIVFNQNIGSWNVSNVTNMFNMFSGAIAFNQNIGSWNVSNVTTMATMFVGVQLSTANYDDLLIGWSTISPNETPLQPNVPFFGGNSFYCNGETARSSIISTYGWTITDAGRDSNCVLETETFDKSNLKLYPNPVSRVINVTVDSNLINQTYSVVDGLGRVVLKGKLNEVETAINVEQIVKGIYYLKLSDNNASKFIKE